MLLGNVGYLIGPSRSNRVAVLVSLLRGNSAIGYVGSLHDFFCCFGVEVFVHDQVIDVFSDVFEAAPNCLLDFVEILLTDVY